MAGENSSTSELPSRSPLLMQSSKLRPGSRLSGKRLPLKDAEVLSQMPHCHSPQTPVEYESAFRDTDDNPQTMMSNLSSRRHSSLSLHSSSSSGESRPTSSSRKKTESSSNNRSTVQDNHLSQTRSRQMSSPWEHLQHRQSISLSSRANSEESPDELSPRQISGKSSLSKYKPLPAIRGKNPGSSSPDILRIPTDCEIDETLMHPQKNSTFQNPANLALGFLKRESSLDPEHLEQVNQHLTNVHLDLKESLTHKIRPHQNYDELSSLPVCPSNSTLQSEMSNQTSIPAEPGPEEPRTLLAVKLPSGQRVHRFFRLSDPLWRVRQFAEISANSNFNDYQLVKSVPREILDLQLTIKENNLLEKMLLYLEMSHSTH